MKLVLSPYLENEEKDRYIYPDRVYLISAHFSSLQISAGDELFVSPPGAPALGVLATAAPFPTNSFTRRFSGQLRVPPALLRSLSLPFGAVVAVSSLSNAPISLRPARRGECLLRPPLPPLRRRWARALWRGRAVRDGQWLAVPFCGRDFMVQVSFVRPILERPLEHALEQPLGHESEKPRFRLLDGDSLWASDPGAPTPAPFFFPTSAFAALRRALTRTAPRGAPRLRGALVTGARGTGKSALLAAAAAWARTTRGLPDLRRQSTHADLSLLFSDSDSDFDSTVSVSDRAIEEGGEGDASLEGLLIIDDVDRLDDATQRLLARAIDALPSGWRALAAAAAPPPPWLARAGRLGDAAADLGALPPAEARAVLKMHVRHLLAACSGEASNAKDEEGRDDDDDDLFQNHDEKEAEEKGEEEEGAIDLRGYAAGDCAALARAACALSLPRRPSRAVWRAAALHVPPSSLSGGAHVDSPSSSEPSDPRAPASAPAFHRRGSARVARVGWSDVAGAAEAKRRLRECVELPLRRPLAFAALGVAPPRGVLLYGPPGTGKTQLARAVAGEVGAPFVGVKGAELLSMWVGESERAVRALFARARRAAPCVLFFDEIDALAPRRGQGGALDRVLTQLLVELDGAEPLEGVAIVAATNRPDLLDEALLRPGRIEHVIHVGLPGEDDRREMFLKRLGDAVLEPELAAAPESLARALAERTEGYTGAEIEGVRREAALLAMRDDEQGAVTAEHFDRALEKVRPKTTLQMLKFYEGFEEKMKKS